MKKLIAVMLSCLSLTFCFCVPAGAGNSEVCSTCVCSESICKEEPGVVKKIIQAVQKGIKNVINHPFHIIRCGIHSALSISMLRLLLHTSPITAKECLVYFSVSSICDAVSLFLEAF